MASHPYQNHTPMHGVRRTVRSLFPVSGYPQRLSLRSYSGLSKRVVA